MVRVYVRHEVDDYGSWREGYDAFHSGPAAGRGVRANVGLAALLPGLRDLGV